MSNVIEVEWTEKIEIDGVPCHLAQLDDGWLIASSGKPRFCFAANERSDAISTAKRGLEFYRVTAPDRE